MPKSEVSAKVVFEPEFKGILVLDDYTIQIGRESNQAKPYDLLQGALISCLHSTFLSILEKKKQSIQTIEYHVNGIKRETIPTMLESVSVDVYFLMDQQSVAIEKSFDLATKYCSIYQTLSHVATMKYTLHFNESYDSIK